MVLRQVEGDDAHGTIVAGMAVAGRRRETRGLAREFDRRGTAHERRLDQAAIEACPRIAGTQRKRLVDEFERALEVAALEVCHAEHVRRVEVAGGERERLVVARDRPLEAARLLVRERAGEDAVELSGNRGRPRIDGPVALLVALPAAAGTRRVAGCGRRDVDGQFVQ
jgi:hypothetical protein